MMKGVRVQMMILSGRNSIFPKCSRYNLNYFFLQRKEKKRMWSRDKTVVCVSCPSHLHDSVATLCSTSNVHKAFGMKGDMVDDLTGEEWRSKWEAKVVMTAVTALKLESKMTGSKHIVLVCISGGSVCDEEYSRQPSLSRAIQKEMPESSVSVEWMELDHLKTKLKKRRHYSSVSYRENTKTSLRKS